jgi:hypothetical protein
VIVQAADEAAASGGRLEAHFKASIVSSLQLRNCLECPAAAHTAVDILEESLLSHPSFTSFLLRPLKAEKEHGTEGDVRALLAWGNADCVLLIA